MPEASESCVSDSSKDLSVLKWWCSGKASWVGQGDCRRHLIGGKVVLFGGGCTTPVATTETPACSYCTFMHRKTVRPGHLGYLLLTLSINIRPEKALTFNLWKVQING